MAYDWAARCTDDPTTWPTCEQCGRTMAPIAYLISVVCLRCCKRNHRRATGKAEKE